MHEIRGADAYFLRQQSGAHHMHTLKIVVVDPSTAHRDVSFDRVRERAAAVLPHLPAFCRRPVRIPLGLGHPIWVDAPEIDPDYHVRHATLPAGGGDAALDELAGRIASEPLDEARPLWQLFYVEGLPAGRVAYITKLHHAVADGLASAELIARSFQTSQDAPQPRPPSVGENEPVPSAPVRLLQAVGRELARQHELPDLIGRSLRSMRIGLGRRIESGEAPARPFAGPRTRFDLPLTPNRVFASTTLPLGALVDVKRQVGCTLNDVFLTLCGGALYHYLRAHRELPAEPLTAAVPVSVRRESDEPGFGNAVSQWFVTTGSHLEDPLERLRLVAKSTRVARELFAAQDPTLAVDWLEHWPLRWLYLDVFQRLGMAALRRPSFNIIASSVPGPRQPLFSDGARVVALRSMGPLAAHQGVNFTAWSYVDDFAIGVHACRERAPDIRLLADGLGEELERLTRVAVTRRAG